MVNFVQRSKNSIIFFIVNFSKLNKFRADQLRQQNDTWVSPCHTCGDTDCAEQEEDTLFIEGSVVNQGSLKSGFGISLYKDNMYATPVTSDGLALGADLYIKAFWTGPIDGIKFYIDKCSYSCGTVATNIVDIVKVSFGKNKTLIWCLVFTP